MCFVATALHRLKQGLEKNVFVLPSSENSASFIGSIEYLPAVDAHLVGSASRKRVTAKNSSIFVSGMATENDLKESTPAHDTCLSLSSPKKSNAIIKHIMISK